MHGSALRIFRREFGEAMRLLRRALFVEANRRQAMPLAYCMAVAMAIAPGWLGGCGPVIDVNVPGRFAQPYRRHKRQPD